MIVKRKNIRVKQHEVDFIKNHYPDYGSGMCSRTLGCKRDRVMGVVKRLRLTHSKEQTTRIFSRGHQRTDDMHRVRSDQFFNLQKPEVAYLLGYVWADGYVTIAKSNQHVFILCIASEDYEVIKESLNRLGDWIIYRSISASGTPMIRIQTYNMKLVKWLIDMGYRQKSYISPCKILEFIPEHLRHYWWRGYFDGDGHFRVRNGAYHFTFAGDYEYDWSEHRRVLDQLSIECRVVQTEKTKHSYGRNSTLVCCNLEGTYRWGTYIYQGFDKDRIGLIRKYEKWEIVRDRYNLGKNLESLHITEAPELELTLDILYGIIGKYEGMITRRKLYTHFKTPQWKIFELMRLLAGQGRIKWIGNGKVRRYIVIDPSVSHEEIISLTL